MSGEAGNRAVAARLCTAAVLAWAALVLLAPAPVAASEAHPTQAEVERRLMCPTCGSTLERSDSESSMRMKAYVRERIADGWTRQQVIDGVVAEYGGDTSVLATPPREGLGWLAWGGPLAVLLIALVGGAAAVVRWKREPLEEAVPGVEDPRRATDAGH